MTIEVEINYKPKMSSSGRIKDGKIMLSISSLLPTNIQQEHIESLISRLRKKISLIEDKQWAKSEINTDEKLESLVKTINEKYYGYKINKVAFRKQTSRWGSCSTRLGNIYVSDKLKDAPLDVLYYLIIHEICHLQEANHSKNFWKLVYKACPDYRELRNKLKEYGYYINSKI